MATLSMYLNGASVGIGNPAPVGGERGRVAGWSAAAVRRHKRWLWSVRTADLDGIGWAVTLTLRDTPATSDDWRRSLLTYRDRVRQTPGVLRWHWVVEWQRRGTPHVHMAVYVAPDASLALRTGHAFVAAWLDVMAPYGALSSGQYLTPIDGPVGWLQYLSKHAARGVAHYQRQGMPPGWDGTGRLWGKGGAWPVSEPLQASITHPEFHRLRRAVRGYAVASARADALRYSAAGEPAKAAGAWRRVAYLRRMLKCADPRLSAVRGVSGWVPESVMLGLLSAASEDRSCDPAPELCNDNQSAIITV